MPEDGIPPQSSKARRAPLLGAPGGLSLSPSLGSSPNGGRGGSPTFQPPRPNPFGLASERAVGARPERGTERPRQIRVSIPDYARYGRPIPDTRRFGTDS